MGFGNIDRADDGVAFEVINALRCRLRQEPLTEGETGLEDLDGQTDSVFLFQLTPEMAEFMADYDRIVFVDAHVYEDAEDLHCVPVMPAYAPSTFTHHMTPAMLMTLVKVLYHAEPAGYIVSIRGYDFDFHRGLSLPTRDLVAGAVDCIQRLIDA